ncbi:hypothetical protein SAMN06272775_1249 [Streptomyces sp. 2323.1]|nr:hypothetical protein SAMN06272775_1249 [Streptomyces sp. 2323.1]
MIDEAGAERVCAVAQGTVLPLNGAPDGGGAGQELSG